MIFAKGSTTYPPVHSPWGAVETRHEIGRGVWRVTTASHGGMWVEPSRRADIPASCQSTPYSGGGWFEEDCDALIVYFACPDTLEGTQFSREDVGRMLRQSASYFTPARLADLGVL
jgi:hypothetical protein